MTLPHAARPTVRVGSTELGGGRLFLIAGPCMLESRELALETAARLAEIAGERNVPLIFKSSFDKANRTSGGAPRGPGMETGLELLAEVKARTGLPVLTDVHLPEQCASAAEVVDVLQIPAFLCRQTDLLLAACDTGRVVNVKKGQFLAPWDMANVAKKCEDAGVRGLILTERGTSFGYGRLIVDMNSFAHLAATGHPVVFDATHSVQEPGGLGGRSGGDRRLVPALARAAVATGDVDGLFFEVHPDPDQALSDGPNMVRLDDFPAILDGVLAVGRAVAALRGHSANPASPSP
ncbi:MAG TPA: 3-deoxy-8-phosphooctulonate synthase [Planctomycetota bacterium]|nr:3-deoxy-8-phosphooctulonate synthase [Planctomycetota bacterium]